MTSRCRSFDVLTRSTLVFVVGLGLATFTACGGDTSSPASGSNPVAPSAAAPITLDGTVVGSSSASAGILSVSVQESPAIFTTIGADGSFSLHGLPAGSFNLVFTRDGTRIGTLPFRGVLAGQQVDVTISLTSSALILLNDQRNDAGHGDLEIEGKVEQVLLLNPIGESRFLIQSYNVVSRPGQTVIRHGNATGSVTDLTVGLRVHVKAVRLPVEGAIGPVLASEIKIQAEVGDGEAPTPTPALTPTPTPSPSPAAQCMIEGGEAGRDVELEGTIMSGAVPSFTLSVSGERASSPVDVEASIARIECTPQSGPKAPTPAQCAASVKPGARVHLDGLLVACSATGAQVLASQVRVGK